MPELPEVEYTARQLRGAVIGATISDAQVFWERTIAYPGLSAFLIQIVGQQITDIRRRGKFLLLDLRRGSADRCSESIVTIHRRMTGNLLLIQPGWEIDTTLRETDPTAWNTRGPSFAYRDTTGETHYSDGQIESKELRYCRVCFTFADGRRLVFTDQRKFGRVELWPREQEHEALVGLGPEPLEADFTVERLRVHLASRKSAIKQVLLAQDVLAGLGNIYADEALFYASIHPLRRASTLTLPEIQTLHAGIISVLTLGIEHGGTSFSNYRGLWGEAGDNYNHVRVYQQAGEPCVRCGTLIERILVGQRGTHFCPHCQRLTAE
jgi:formamidopyrimidine-DNA glycosylase